MSATESPDVTAGGRPVWAELRDAIRGTGADYTKIPLKRAVFLLAVPMVLELVLESTFAVVDIFFVAKLGSSAVATVGLTETMLFLLYAIGIGLAMAVTAVVARRIGEGKPAEAAVTAVQAIWIALLASVPFAVAGIVFAQDLLRLMGADAWTLTHGYPYMQWVLGSNAVILLLFTINAIFRGAGDAAAAMRVLWFANGLNIVLDPILIFGYRPGACARRRGRGDSDGHRPRRRRAAAALDPVPRRASTCACCARSSSGTGRSSPTSCAPRSAASARWSSR